MKTRVFSGARPTGRQHIGNYLGAIQNYVTLQESGEFDCLYCIVDYHALTTMEEVGVSHLRGNIIDMAADWLAAGLDPNKATIFVQSHVPQVAELMLCLSMVTPIGQLMRSPSFKEKVKYHPDNVNYGLLGYPVLMAADILLYKAEVVPVGEDQLAHLELAREIVRRFNYHFGPTFPEPQPRLTSFPRVMGIDGKYKMSKSLDNYIELAADEPTTRELVGQMVTDPTRRLRTDPGHPEICNVYTLHRFFSPPERVAAVEQGCRSAALGCVECKTMLADDMNAQLADFRARRATFSEDYIRDVLREGAKKAAPLAEATLLEVKGKMGLA